MGRLKKKKWHCTRGSAGVMSFRKRGGGSQCLSAGKLWTGAWPLCCGQQMAQMLVGGWEVVGAVGVLFWFLWSSQLKQETSLLSEDEGDISVGIWREKSKWVLPRWVEGVVPKFRHTQKTLEGLVKTQITGLVSNSLGLGLGWRIFFLVSPRLTAMLLI